MSRHSTGGESSDGFDLAQALREALARRQAAERAGQEPRRRRGFDDDEPADPAVTAHPGAVAPLPVAVGWPAGEDAPASAAPVRSSSLGWPADGPGPPVVGPPAAPPETPAVPARPSIPPPTSAPAPASALAPASAQAPASTPPPASTPTERPAPGRGWRRLLYVLTRGAMNPGESPEERRRRARAEQIGGSTPGCYRIAVISLKGGVGKTTMSFCLGAVLASLRPDRVIAVDANPDRGTLGSKVAPQTRATVRDLLDGLAGISSYSDLRAYTSQSPDRLEILASSADPALSDAFSEQDYRRVLAVLEYYYNVVVTDCGTGLLHSAMSGVLDLADQLVVVSTNSVDGANSASATLDWLQAHGHADLVRGSVAVINAVVPRAGNVDQDRLAAHFESRCRAVIRMPHDDSLESGAEVQLAHLGQPTRDALYEFTLAVLDGQGETAGPAG